MNGDLTPTTLDRIADEIRVAANWVEASTDLLLAAALPESESPRPSGPSRSGMINRPTERLALAPSKSYLEMVQTDLLKAIARLREAADCVVTQSVGLSTLLRPKDEAYD